MARTAPIPSPSVTLSDPDDPDGSEPARSRGRHAWPRRSQFLVRRVWVLPVLATLAGGLYRISTPVLWHDELATLTVVRRPRGAIIAMLHNVDAVHGAYYLLLHYWVTVFGDSPAVLRLPTVLAMSGAAGCVALTGRRMFGSRAGLAGGLVLALMPTVTRYGQEARSYGFVVLCAAVALQLLLRAVERPSVLRWLCYALSVSAAAYLHLVSLVFLGAHAVGVLLFWWKDRRNWRRPVGFGAAAALGLAPAYPLIKLGERQSGRQIGWITHPHLADLVAIWPQLFGSTLLTGAVILAGAMAWGSGRRIAPLLATLCAVLPVLLVWGVSRYSHVSYFMPKYLFFVLPAWAVLAGAGIALLRIRGTVVALTALGLLALPAQLFVHRPLSHADYLYPEPVTWFTPLDYRAAARVVASGFQPGDGAAYGQQRAALWWGVDTGVQYYLPKGVKPRDVLAGRSGEERNDLWPDVCPNPAACLGDEPRIWLVSKDDGGDPFTTVVPAAAAALQERYRLTTVTHVSGISVALLVRR